MSSSNSAGFVPLLARRTAEEPVETADSGGLATLTADREAADASTALPTPELRSGRWTRFGDDAVLGDQVTESTLARLAESAHAAAQAQGYSVGWAQGRREATARAEATAREHEARMSEDRAHQRRRHDEAMKALTETTRQLAQATAEVWAHVDARALGLARELTERLVGHELRSTVGADTGADVVARVLGSLPPHAPVCVRLHPEVAAGPAVGVLADAAVEVVADGRLGPGDALVEVDGAVIDLRLDQALERIRQVLS